MHMFKWSEGDFEGDGNLLVAYGFLFVIEPVTYIFNHIS